MTAAFYGKGAKRIADQTLNWVTDTIKVVALKNTYVADLTVHEFYSDISANVLGPAVTLTGKATIAGNGKVSLDCDDFTLTGLVAGSTINALAFYKDTGVAGTSPLIAYDQNVDVFPYATAGISLSVAVDVNGVAQF